MLARDAGARLLVADLGIDWQGRTPPPEIVRMPVAAGHREPGRAPGDVPRPGARGS